MTDVTINYNNRMGSMTLHLDKVFIERGDKILHAVHTRKVINQILKLGSDENIEQVQSFLKENSPLWAKEFEKMKIKKRRR